MLVVDAHAHLFSADETRYPPRKDPSRPPVGTGTIDHLRREMAAAGVTAVTAVQVSGFYGFDNRYMCDASQAHPDWIAGIVTLDPSDPASPSRLAAMAGEFGVKGLRSVPTRDGRIDDPHVRALWRAAHEHSLVVNLQVDHQLADDADRLLEQFPELPVVLDHSLKLEAGGPVRETLAALAKLARRPNCHAKVSNIANGPEGCSDGYPCRSFQPVMLQVIDLFGPERCAWGAHFPLEKYSPRLTYRQALQIYTEELPLNAQARAWIVGETANRLWFGGALREKEAAGRPEGLSRPA
ncbi:MAG: amidohydrolase family protein [Acidobacteria bacterium]|nr:amidohydrolase family protein [Acidobacteriota bacterium]